MQQQRKNQQEDILNELGAPYEEAKVLDNLLQDLYRGSYDTVTLRQHFARLMQSIANPLSHKVSLV